MPQKSYDYGACNPSALTFERMARMLDKLTAAADAGRSAPSGGELSRQLNIPIMSVPHLLKILEGRGLIIRTGVAKGRVAGVTICATGKTTTGAAAYTFHRPAHAPAVAPPAASANKRTYTPLAEKEPIGLREETQARAAAKQGSDAMAAALGKMLARSPSAIAERPVRREAVFVGSRHDTCTLLREANC